MIFHKLKLTTATASLLLAAFLITGCHIQPSHPNQMNTFDGATYDALTLTHSALTSLRTSISTDFPEYSSEFNEAVEAYNTAFAVYASYRISAGATSSVSVALGNLTVSITSLETAIINDLNADTQDSTAVRKTALKIRQRTSTVFGLSDILTQLEVAASIASIALHSQGHMLLANAIINATEAAILAEESSRNQPIQLASIAAVTPIS